jgi:glutamate formiminotransferase
MPSGPSAALRSAMHLIECVPNVSEGRRPEVVDALAAALRAVPGVALLDDTADPSHNRSVFTLAGNAQALERAIVALTERAVAAIDLRQQRGEHPRVGAVDVVPFIPLGATPLDACVDLARSVGRHLAERFGIPVYLYEDASTSPLRRRLEHIRQGQFEGLAAKMRLPEWTPDFGPRVPHPSAGATIVGARHVLIAYNINLATARLDVAQSIARSIRESSGGLPCVKALGLTLQDRGIVQVSMNLTDYERTPLQTVFDTVQTLAASFGVDLVESELIGLIPAAALAATTPAHLRLRDFSADRILEYRLRAAGLLS